MHPTRLRILQTAPAVFAESGFAGSSTRRLAAAAGVNIATLAYHFGDKHGLYEATLDHAYGMLIDTPMLDVAELPRRERARAFVADLYQTAREHQDSVRLLLRHIMAEGKLPDGVSKRGRHRLMQRLQDSLDTLKVGEADPLVLMSLTHLIAHYAVSDPSGIARFSLGRDPHEAVIDHLTAIARSQLRLS